MRGLVSWVCRCGEENWMTPELDRVLRRSQATFYCVHGHSGVWPVGESEEDKLRRERNYLKQQMAQKDDEIRQWRATADDQCARRKVAEEQAEHQKRRANGYKGHATKITKRAKAGVCPCCNRSFENLRRHMATKHPTFTPIEIDQVPQEATIQ